MSKNKNNYFELMEEQARLCLDGASLLIRIINNFSPEDIPKQKENMHLIENTADDLHHEILTKLSAEFITPIDQEDILRLVQIMDDVIDSLDETVLELYMYHIENIPPFTMELSNVAYRCVKELYEAIKELKNFKKPDKLRKHLIEINTIESEGDAIHVEAIHHLFANPSDAKILISSKSIYASLEHCLDICEYASEEIEQIIIKNT